jgi:hypothetical protein
MEKTTPPTDYESMKKKALEQFRSGKSLTGKGGAFAPLLKQFLEAALQSELEEHLMTIRNLVYVYHGFSRAATISLSNNFIPKNLLLNL